MAKFLDYSGLQTVVTKIKTLLSGKEDTANKKTSVSSSSTDTDYPSSKAVYTYAPPKSHASSDTTYGVGTTSNYGHCMTINNLTTSRHTDGKALSAYQGYLLGGLTGVPSWSIIPDSSGHNAWKKIGLYDGSFRETSSNHKGDTVATWHLSTSHDFILKYGYYYKMVISFTSGETTNSKTVRVEEYILTGDTYASSLNNMQLTRVVTCVADTSDGREYTYTEDYNIPEIELSLNKSYFTFSDLINKYVFIKGYKSSPSDTATHTYDGLYLVVDNTTLRGMSIHKYNEKSGSSASTYNYPARYDITYVNSVGWVPNDIGISEYSTTVSSSSTHNQYPTSKAVYDFVNSSLGVTQSPKLVLTDGTEPSLTDNRVYSIPGLSVNGTDDNDFSYSLIYYWTSGSNKYISLLLKSSGQVNKWKQWKYDGSTWTSNSKEMVPTYTATIPTAGWSNSAPYTVSINVTGILNTDNPTIGLVQSDTLSTRQAQREAWSKISRITTSNGSITVYADEEKPTTAIPIQIKCIR